MIRTLNHLYYVLRSSEEEINAIVGNIDDYYYFLRKPKKKFGAIQRDKGKIRYRHLLPSAGRLKIIQERINFFLQKKHRAASIRVWFNKREK